MQLTEHFTLEEMVVSETAARQGIANEPDSSAITRLRRLCQCVLEPLRTKLGKPIVITSGYRSAELNQAIGGSRHSLHQQGRAADIIIPYMSPYEVCQTVLKMQLPCAQIIHEFGRWSHIAIAELDEATELLTAMRIDGKTVYQRGLHEV